MQTTGACQVGTSTAGSQHCLRFACERLCAPVAGRPAVRDLTQLDSSPGAHKRLDIRMPLASPLDSVPTTASPSTAPGGDWTSWPVWVPLGVIVAVVVGILLIWLTWKLVFSRQRLYYSVLVTPLVAVGGSRFSDKLRIFYGEPDDPLEKPLSEPVVVSIRLASRSAKDIPTAAFDDRKPLALNLGRPVVAMLGRAADNVTSRDSEILVGPGLIRKNQVIRLTVLVDGQPTVEINDPPLIDVTVAERPWTSPVGPWWKDKSRIWPFLAAVILTLLVTAFSGLLINFLSSL